SIPPGRSRHQFISRLRHPLPPASKSSSARPILRPGPGCLPPKSSGPLVARCIVSLMANDPFRALAHPTRRAIVERLARGPVPIGEATGGLGVSKPTISRHVKVLEEAGVVVRTIEGRTHRIGLDLDALAGAVGWLDRQRAIWERMF